MIVSRVITPDHPVLYHANIDVDRPTVCTATLLECATENKHLTLVPATSPSPPPAPFLVLTLDGPCSRHQHVHWVKVIRLLITQSQTMPITSQAAWATLLLEVADTPPSIGPFSATDNTITGSDLIRGGEVPVLLAADTLGRVGLLRYPAKLPEPPAATPTVESIAGEGCRVLTLLKSDENMFWLYRAHYRALLIRSIAIVRFQGYKAQHYKQTYKHANYHSYGGLQAFVFEPLFQRDKGEYSCMPSASGEPVVRGCFRSPAPGYGKHVTHRSPYSRARISSFQGCDDE